MSDTAMGDLISEAIADATLETTPADLEHLGVEPKLDYDPPPKTEEARKALEAEIDSGAVLVRGTGKKRKEYRFDLVAGIYVDKKGQPLPARRRASLPSIRRQDFKLDTRSVFEKDRAILGAMAEYDADGYLRGNAGKKGYGLKPRAVYRRGTFFRVAVEGVRMETQCFYGRGANGKPIWSGWARELPVGTIVECIGWRRFRKDLPLVAPQFVYAQLPAEAKWSNVWPKDGVFRPWPLDGILTPLTAEEAEAYKAARDA